MNLKEAMQIMQNNGYIMEKVNKELQDHIDYLVDAVEKLGCNVSFGLTAAGKRSNSNRFDPLHHGHKSSTSNPSHSRKTFKDKMYVYIGGEELGWFGIDAKGKYNYAAWVYQVNSYTTETKCVVSLESISSSRQRYDSPEEWIDAIERCVNSLETFQNVSRKVSQIIKLGHVD